MADFPDHTIQAAEGFGHVQPGGVAVESVPSGTNVTIR